MSTGREWFVATRKRKALEKKVVEIQDKYDKLLIEYRILWCFTFLLFLVFCWKF